MFTIMAAFFFKKMYEIAILHVLPNVIVLFIGMLPVILFCQEIEVKSIMLMILNIYLLGFVLY